MEGSQKFKPQDIFVNPCRSATRTRPAVYVEAVSDSAKVVLCRARVCSVGNDIPYITYRTCRVRYGGLHKNPQLQPGICIFLQGHTGAPGVGGNISYRRYRTVGYRFERLTEHTELSSTGMGNLGNKYEPWSYPGYTKIPTLQNTTLNYTVMMIYMKSGPSRVISLFRFRS